MRSIYSFMSWLKGGALLASVFTLCFSPVAMGAEAKAQNKKMVNEFLKGSGIMNPKLTVGQYWSKVRHVYPKDIQAKLDPWVQQNANMPMPKIQATTFKDKAGREQVRLTLSGQGQSMTLTVIGGDKEFAKINSVNFSRKELQDFNKVAKKLGQDPSLKKKPGYVAHWAQPAATLSARQVMELSPKKRAEYFLKLRRTMEAAEKVMARKYGVKTVENDFENKNYWFFELFKGSEAFAANMRPVVGDACIIAGYVSAYGEGGSCGGTQSGWAALQNQMSQAKANCSGGGVSCNPLFYGYQDGGAPHCISRAQAKFATRECNKKSPLVGDADQQRIINSYMKHNQMAANVSVTVVDGKVTKEEYGQIEGFLTGLEDYYRQAMAVCDADVPEYKRQDQDSACQELRTRFFKLSPKGEFLLPPPPVPPTVNVEDGARCEAEMRNSVPDAEGKCICPENTKKGTIDEGAGPVPACIVNEDTAAGGVLPGGKDVPAGEAVADSCGYWCRNKNWIIPVGVGLAALGLFWWLFKDDDDDDDDKYVPPVSVSPTPSPSPTVTPAPTVEPPPVTCNPPNTLVMGVCTPPVIVPPPPVTSEGGTQTDAPGRAGGIR